MTIEMAVIILVIAAVIMYLGQGKVKQAWRYVTGNSSRKVKHK